MDTQTFEFPDVTVLVLHLLRDNYLPSGGDSSRTILASKWDKETSVFFLPE